MHRRAVYAVWKCGVWGLPGCSGSGGSCAAPAAADSPDSPEACEAGPDHGASQAGGEALDGRGEAEMSAVECPRVNGAMTMTGLEASAPASSSISRSNEFFAAWLDLAYMCQQSSWSLIGLCYIWQKERCDSATAALATYQDIASTGPQVPDGYSRNLDQPIGK